MIPRILSKVYREPWLIKPETHAAIRHALDAKLAGNPHSDLFGGVEGAEDEHDDMQQEGSVAVIPVYGIMGKHLSSLEMACGGCSVDAVQGMIQLALEDDSVDRILLDIDSPGGTVTGVPELAAFISEATKRKPICAFTESMACSAAMWVASQADSIFVTPSSEVGSVGVYAVYLDESRALENEGVKVNAICSGKYKLTGAPWRPMSDDERSMLQASVDKIHSQFKAAVASKRPVNDEDMEGQTFDGDEAVKHGYADAVVSGLPEAVRWMRQLTMSKS